MKRNKERNQDKDTLNMTQMIIVELNTELHNGQCHRNTSATLMQNVVLRARSPMCRILNTSKFKTHWSYILRTWETHSGTRYHLPHPKTHGQHSFPQKATSFTHPQQPPAQLLSHCACSKPDMTSLLPIVSMCVLDWSVWVQKLFFHIKHCCAGDFILSCTWVIAMFSSWLL